VRSVKVQRLAQLIAVDIVMLIVAVSYMTSGWRSLVGAIGDGSAPPA
jgi:hypothetical protein